MKRSTIRQGSKSRATLLKAGLRANALFSSLCGVCLLVWGGGLADFLGFGLVWALRALGAGLLLFALELAYQAARTTPILWRARAAVALDWGWVLGSAALLWGFPDLYTEGGGRLIAGVAAAVGALALIQGLGLARGLDEGRRPRPSGAGTD